MLTDRLYFEQRKAFKRGQNHDWRICCQAVSNENLSVEADGTK